MPDNAQVQVETLGSGLTQGARRATEVSPEPATDAATARPASIIVLTYASHPKRTCL